MKKEQENNDGKRWKTMCGDWKRMKRKEKRLNDGGGMIEKKKNTRKKE